MSVVVSQLRVSPLTDQERVQDSECRISTAGCRILGLDSIAS